MPKQNKTASELQGLIMQEISGSIKIGATFMALR